MDSLSKSQNTTSFFVQTPAEFLEVGYHRCRIGLNHLAFYGGSRKQVDQLRKDLITRSVNLLYEDRYPYAGGENHYALNQNRGGGELKEGDG